jgi:hypothetical protein
MKMLSKSEMEDIWRNKPVGYLMDFQKKMKGKKRFLVTWKPYTTTRTYLKPIVGVVVAKTQSEAKKLADGFASYHRTELRKLVPTDMFPFYEASAEEVR